VSSFNTIKSSTNHNKHSITTREQIKIERIQSRVDVKKTFTFINSFNTLHVDSKKAID